MAAARQQKPGDAPEPKPFYPARIGKWNGAAYPKSVLGTEYEHIGKEPLRLL